mmetsp:Transcript_83327/g.231230  ORF Transcript_83327/g.231230 Transcript_83327/m.231230 type:complete len:207 (+) Transcript_83327:812-1432(+)
MGQDALRTEALDAIHLPLQVAAQRRRHRMDQRAVVRSSGLRLVHEGKVLAGADPLREERVVALDPAEGAVVHRPATHEAVVGVEVALAEAHAQPAGNHGPEPLCRRFQHGHRTLLECAPGRNVRVLAEQSVLNHLPVLFALLRPTSGSCTARKQVHMAHAQEARCDSRGDGAGLDDPRVGLPHVWPIRRTGVPGPRRRLRAGDNEG